MALTFFALNAFAGETTLFKELAQSTVTTMYMRSGDSVSVKLLETKNTAEVLSEKWEVTLSNGAAVGSASYEVEVVQKVGGANEGDEVASVKVKYLFGN